MLLLCTRNRKEMEIAKFWWVLEIEKYFWKFFLKYLVVIKICPIFALAFRLKNGEFRLEILIKNEIKFFEDIEQLRSFIHSWERVISNNTFEIRAKIYKQFIFTMESLILAQDER